MIPIAFYSKTYSFNITHAKHTSILANNGRYRSNGRRKRQRNEIVDQVFDGVMIAANLLGPLIPIALSALGK